jgi:hypothetical protein
VNLKFRQLSKRVKDVYGKYKNNSNLIYKEFNRWFIHNKLICEFKRKRNPINYKLYVTIASKNDFEVKYWKTFISMFYKELKTVDSSTRLKYVIENNRRDTPHLHFITTYENKADLRRKLNEHYITSYDNDMDIDIQNVWEVKGLHEYFRKQNKPVLFK